jgi:fumarate reductase flavoprotein subunit
MLLTQSDRAIAESNPARERMKAIALIHDAGCCHGAGGRELAAGELGAQVAKAALGNIEALQIHPPGSFPPGILVTEGCRGDGGWLKDVDGHRFMPDDQPGKEELALRDVVSRRMEPHIRKGKSALSRFGEHLWLDITLLGRVRTGKNLREATEICESFVAIDAEQSVAVRAVRTAPRPA